MNLRFRKATEEDIAMISSLADKIWREHYPAIISTAQIDFMLQNRYSPDVIRQGMHRGENYFLAFASDEPVAYASIELKEGVYWLHKFYVDVLNHRSGIGQRFFYYVLEQSDLKHPIRLQVNRQNYKAVNFYFKMGFIIESIGDFDIGGGYFMNDFVMIRK